MAISCKGQLALKPLLVPPKGHRVCCARGERLDAGGRDEESVFKLSRALAVLGRRLRTKGRKQDVTMPVVIYV